MAASFAMLFGALPAHSLEMPGPLSRVHQDLVTGEEGCDACHDQEMKVDGARCVVCHDQIAERMRSKRGVHREVGVTDCATCHQEHQGVDHDLRGFDTAGFDHAAETGFPLVGGHAHLVGNCSACHKERSFLGNSPQCASCHSDAHAGLLGQTCTACHTPGNFRNATRAFHKGTRFPLEGRHLEVACADCHLDGVVAGTPTDCFDCHWIRRQDDRYRTRLGGQCAQCHTPTSWTAVKWQHEAATGFALGTPHRRLPCDACHAGGNFEPGVPRDCVGCHLKDYQRAQDPNHVAAGFPTTCELCHRPSDSSFEQGRFAHPFQLVGVHATLPCSACHGGGVYQGTPTACVGCHLANYQAATDPNHVAAGFPTTCENCHNASDSSFAQGRFNHPFQLVGVHATLACSACHGGGVYQGTPTECVGCHLAAYQAATSPNHVAAGFPPVCDACHLPTDQSFAQGRYSHNTWPLVGAHTRPACSDCHTSNVYQGLSTACVSCHLADYEGATDPNHVAAGFPTTCELCHDPADGSWQGTHFQHPFQLVGVHATLACSACHGGGVYQGTPTACVGCHLANYEGATNPNHQAAGFPTTCESCHLASDQSFQQGRYAHSVWPLVGAHTQPTCVDCHTGTVYQGLPSECVSCHLADYQATTNPNHQAAGFPTTCELCHSPADGSFAATSFNHDAFFRTSSGPHSGWPCSLCHPSPADFGVFQCTTGCHPQAQTDSNHAGISGYAYSSSLCLACHPNGSAPKGRPSVGLRSSHVRS